MLKKLPEAHFTVMSTFMLHLHKSVMCRQRRLAARDKSADSLSTFLSRSYRVQQHKEENKMTPANLGVVFSRAFSSIACLESPGFCANILVADTLICSHLVAEPLGAKGVRVRHDQRPRCPGGH